MATRRRRAVFVNPPLYVGADFIDYPYFTNYETLASAALVARAGWAVDVVDAFALPGTGRWPDGDGWRLGASYHEVLDALPDRAPDVVVVGASPFLRLHAPDPRTAALVAGLRRRWPRAVLLLADGHLGGMHHVEVDFDTVQRALPEVDAYLRYAGERSLSAPERLLALRGARRVVDEPAEVWPPGYAPPMPMLDAIDVRALGRMLHHCFADGAWANPFAVTPTTLPIVTSSGCPHRCVFCTSNPGWRRTGRKPYRIVPLEALEDWLYLYVRVLGATKLFVLDEMANVRPDFDAVLDLVERMGVRCEFPNGLRADRLGDATIDRLAGLVTRLSVSVESANAAHLAGPIGKRLDPRHVERVAARCARVGLPLIVHFIVGFPWERRQDVLETLQLAWHLYEAYGAEPAVQFATPLRGTALHDTCVEMGLVGPQGADSTDPAMFQHRPAFVPPAIPPGWLETARGALHAKLRASRARKVILNITYSCVNRCEFCATGDRARKFVPWWRIERILRRHRADGVRNLDIDGGEPTLHPHLVDTIRLAARLGYRQINVTTNGRRLAERRHAEPLLHSGLTSLLVSLHGATAEVHDAITGVPGSFAETVAGLRQALALRPLHLAVGVNVTVVRKNVDTLLDLAALTYALGVRRLNLQMVTPFGNAWSGVVPAETHAAARIREVLDRWADRMEVAVVNGQPCLLPGHERHVLPDLQKLGRTMIFVWDEEVNLFHYLAARRRRVAACTGCPYSITCDGFYDFTLNPAAVAREATGG